MSLNVFSGFASWDEGKVVVRLIEELQTLIRGALYVSPIACSRLKAIAVQQERR